MAAAGFVALPGVQLPPGTSRDVSRVLTSCSSDLSSDSQVLPGPTRPSSHGAAGARERWAMLGGRAKFQVRIGFQCSCGAGAGPGPQPVTGEVVHVASWAWPAGLSATQGSRRAPRACSSLPVPHGTKGRGRSRCVPQRLRRVLAASLLRGQIEGSGSSRQGPRRCMKVVNSPWSACGRNSM